jgi:RNA polymerase sigma factor (sigma-70 family)
MSESESILLQRFARTGDPEVFSELVQRHAGLVYGACLRILADKDRAADAVQDTFFQLLRNARNITGSLPNWLHKVATRKAIDVLRRDSSRKQREAQYAANKPSEVTKWQDLSPYIDEVLEELDDQTREIIVQHFFEGKTTTDIAGKQGTSQPTVSRRIESGVAWLREKLRSRGIIVTVGVLATLLVENAAQAAPAVVLKELGKMALVGTQVATASGAGTAASGAGAKAAGGVLTGVKAKIITAAAVTVIGVGSVVTYQQITSPLKQTDELVAEETSPFYSGRSSKMVQSRRPAQRGRTIVEQPEELTAIPSEPRGYQDTADYELVELMTGNLVPQGRGKDEPTGGYAGGYGGYAMGGGETGIQNNESPDAGENAPMGGMGYGGGYFFGGTEDSNAPDSNSPSDHP